MTVLIYKLLFGSYDNWKYVCLHPNTRLIVGIDDNHTTHRIEGNDYSYGYWNTTIAYYKRVGAYVELSPDDPEYKRVMLLML